MVSRAVVWAGVLLRGPREAGVAVTVTCGASGDLGALLPCCCNANVKINFSDVLVVVPCNFSDLPSANS